ncbi:MaoC family dehydratase N-terminal domain-containing protein [soil metagenome]
MFANWIGRKTEAEDEVSERLVSSFRATLDPNLAHTSAEAAPLGLHWCLSPATAPMAELGPDGHPAKNRNLPPVPLPRRMWAGGMIEAFDTLRTGDRVRRVSTIAEIVKKQGKAGDLWFVTVSHDYTTARGLAIRDRQDIVYREAVGPRETAPAPRKEPAERAFDKSVPVQMTPVLLFRYSAITFNSHRIHYDYPYATGVEGYDGLVVHGPLQATLLYNLAATVLGAIPKQFIYRGVVPAIAGGDLMVCSGNGTFWTQSMGGQIYMDVTVSP